METILARSPTAKYKGQKRPAREKAQKRFDRLFRKREPYERWWKEIRKYELPFHGDFEENKARGESEEIYNSTARDAAAIFAGGVMSGLTPPSRQWFKLALAGKDTPKEAGIILDERQAIMQNVLARSNFYHAVYSCYHDLPFGQAPLGIFSAADGVHFMHYPIGSYALDTDATGRVNTFARKVRMTAAQIVEQFGEDNAPQTVRDAAKNKSDRMFVVCWLVEPNTERRGGRLGPQSMPYRSLYWVEGSPTDEYLALGGMEEWPVPVARYQVIGLEPYAKGAGWYALADSKMLQVMERDILTAIEMGIKPPMQTSGATMPSVNMFPGGVTVNAVADGVRPLFDVQLNVQAVQAKIEQTEQKVRRAYAADLFLMLDQIERGQMTAREIMERTQEKLQQLGPVVERLQYEFLNPTLERVYGILDRGGVFPPLPPELAEQLGEEEVRIEYISPLAQAQKMSGLINIEQTLAFAGQVAQMFPEVLTKIDAMAMLDVYHDNIGAPAAMLRSTEEAQQIIAAQQEAQQQEEAQAAQMASIQQAAPLAQAAKNLTDAANDGNPAIREWLGMPNAGGGAL